MTSGWSRGFLCSAMEDWYRNHSGEPLACPPWPGWQERWRCWHHPKKEWWLWSSAHSGAAVLAVHTFLQRLESMLALCGVMWSSSPSLPLSLLRLHFVHLRNPEWDTHHQIGMYTSWICYGYMTCSGCCCGGCYREEHSQVVLGSWMAGIQPGSPWLAGSTVSDASYIVPQSSSHLIPWIWSSCCHLILYLRKVRRVPDLYFWTLICRTFIHRHMQKPQSLKCPFPQESMEWPFIQIKKKPLIIKKNKSKSTLVISKIACRCVITSFQTFFFLS